MVKQVIVSIIVPLALLGVATCGGAAAAAQFSEYEVKAAYLYNFTRFVEWPSDEPERDEFTICILGKNPFGDAFDGIVGKMARNRRIVLKQIQGIEEAGHCNILFISNSERGKQKAILLSLGSARGILTVSDSDHFALNGGMIGLVTVGGRIRFEINQRAARQANLRISSHMLKLALKILD